MEDIKEKLIKIVKDFSEERSISVNLSNFENLDLKNYFDFSELYDLECIIEDCFFKGEDIIPDTQYTKMQDLINFIKIETVLKEEASESSLTSG